MELDKTGHNSNSNSKAAAHTLTRGRDSRFEGDYPGHPAHPTPALQPSTTSWLPNLAGFDARDAVPSGPLQKVGSRKFQGVIVPALAWILFHRVPDVLDSAKCMLCMCMLYVHAFST